MNIFVLYDEKRYVLPLYIFDSRYARVCEMLMLKDIDNKNNIKSHYILISDLSKLLCSYTNTHHKAYFCRWCLPHFYK